MRPRSIVWFERTTYLWFGLSTVNTFIVYYRIRAQPTDPSHAGPGILFAILFLSLAIYWLLLWLIAYRANNVARWIFVILTGIGLLSLLQIREIIAFGGVSPMIALVENFLSVALIWLLFRADSRDWFAGRRPVDPAIFD